MKLRGVRRIAFAAVAAALVASLVGLSAGPASALPKRECDEVLQQVYTDWGLSDIYAADGRDASAAGDYIGAAYYNTLAAQYNTAGNRLYGYYTMQDC